MEIKDILYEKTYNRIPFIDKINDAIRNKNLVQRQIAADLGLYPQNLNAFLKGKMAMSTEKIKKLTDYVGL
jgi:predicted XRE-type DNA-binding protein